MAGRVLVGGAPSTNPSRLVASGEVIRLAPDPPRYVSRAGEKLHAALHRFGIDVTGARALDVGSSTGGFTDCLLQHGAEQVVAVDVGRNQLHERLRADGRVRSRERTDIRALAVEPSANPSTVATVDVSFTSLRTVLPAVLAQLAPGAPAVLLVKPQFEADRAAVSRGRGVVRDPQIWVEVLDRTAGTVTDLGAAIMGTMVSPLRGADGNVEFLVHVLAPGHGRADLGHLDAAAVVAEVGP